MLHVSAETLLFLKQQQAAAEAAERRRLAIAIRKPARKLNEKTFERLVANVSIVLRDGFPTFFEFEASCRHGLRVAFIFEGWSWADADTAALLVVSTAIHRIGAKRPTWNEGQIDYSDEGRFYCLGCARCGARIDDERNRNGTPAKYCSSLCGNAARQAKGRASGERMALADYLASLALKSAQTLRERSGDCETCRKPFVSSRADRRFCSLQCAGEGNVKHKEKPCSQCNAPFKPRLGKGKEAIYCSKSCARIASIKPILPRVCMQCAEEFLPNSHRDQPFCSHKCAMAKKIKPRPEVSCPTCRGVFRWRQAEKPQTYCSQPCNPRSPNFVGRSAFNCEEVG